MCPLVCIGAAVAFPTTTVTNPAYRACVAKARRPLARLRSDRELPPRRLDFGLAAPSASSVVATELGR